jgi:hypothetical protein
MGVPGSTADTVSRMCRLLEPWLSVAKIAVGQVVLLTALTGQSMEIGSICAALCSRVPSAVHDGVWVLWDPSSFSSRPSISGLDPVPVPSSCYFLHVQSR